MKDRKGQAGALVAGKLLTNKYVIGALAGVLVFVLGFGFFFNKIFLLAIFGGLFYLVLNGQYNLENAMPLIGLAVLVPVLWTFFGVASVAPNVSPQGSIASGLDGGEEIRSPNTNIEVSAPKGQGTSAPVASSTIAPRTYREVTVKMANTDNLPLIMNSAKVIGWMGQCNGEEEKQPKYCDMQEGQTISITTGWMDGLAEYTKKSFRQNHVGITGKNPEERGLWDKASKDWKDVMVIRDFDMEGKNGGESAILWKPSKCRSQTLENVDCNNAQTEYTFDEFGYIWADKKAEVPSQHQLQVAVLRPKGQTLTNQVVWALSFGGINNQKYDVVALKGKKVNIANPEIQLLVALSALGLLASVAAYARVPPFNMLPAAAA